MAKTPTALAIFDDSVRALPSMPESKGVAIASVTLFNPATISALRTAKRLKQTLIMTIDESGSHITFHAAKRAL